MDMQTAGHHRTPETLRVHMGIGNGTLPDENSTSVEIGSSYDAVPADSLKGATLSARMGRVLALQDFRNVEIWRAAVFEGTASMIMVLVGILATISILEAGYSSPVLYIAIFQGLILSLAILAAGPATGGHVNPCITFTEMLTGHISPVRCLLYILAQSLGSIVGAFWVKAIVGEVLATQYSLGGCYLHSQVSATSGVVGLATNRAFLIEVGMAFFVLFVSYSIALDPPQLPKTGYILAPFMVGGVVGLCIYCSGGLISGYGGAGINPGRCIGPAVAMGGVMWTNHWVFWLGPGTASVAMAILYHTIPPTHIEKYRNRKAQAKAGGRQLGRKPNPYSNYQAQPTVLTPHPKP